MFIAESDKDFHRAVEVSGGVNGHLTYGPNPEIYVGVQSELRPGSLALEEDNNLVLVGEPTDDYPVLEAATIIPLIEFLEALEAEVPGLTFEYKPER